MRKTLFRILPTALVITAIVAASTQPTAFYIGTAYRARQEAYTGEINSDPSSHLTVSFNDERNAVVVSDRSTGHQLGRFPYAQGQAAALNRDGRVLAIATDKNVELWDVGTAELTARIDRRAHRMAFSPDGKKLALQDHPIRRCAPSRHELLLYDLDNQQQTACETVYLCHPRYLEFSPDSTTLCVGDHNQLAYWKVSDGRVSHQFNLASLEDTLVNLFIFGSMALSLRALVRGFIWIRNRRRRVHAAMLRDAEDRQAADGRRWFCELMGDSGSSEPIDVGRRIKGIIRRLGPYGSPPKPICTRS